LKEWVEAPSLDPFRKNIDAQAFEAACAAGELNEALRLYAGDFLQGLLIEGCEAFEEWAFFRREALRSRLVQALERLIERELVAGDARAATATATRLVGLDPLSESAQRPLAERRKFAHSGRLRQRSNCDG
jgi:DNA-binding SARP family transcriptional activator